MRNVLKMIWGARLQEYFTENRKLRLDNPVNKLPDGQIT